MKNLILGLLLSTQAHATTPNECLEMVRGYWVAKEALSNDTQMLFERFRDQCVPEDLSNPPEMLALIKNDEHIQGIIKRLKETGVYYHQN